MNAMTRSSLCLFLGLISLFIMNIKDYIIYQKQPDTAMNSVYGILLLVTCTIAYFEEEK
jgi:hypothetical protein